jgi:hypothetical protein
MLKMEESWRVTMLQAWEYSSMHKCFIQDEYR